MNKTPKYPPIPGADPLEVAKSMFHRRRTGGDDRPGTKPRKLGAPAKKGTAAVGRERRQETTGVLSQEPAKGRTKDATRTPRPRRALKCRGS